MSAGVGTLFAVFGAAGELGVFAGLVELAVGLGVDVGVGVCADDASPGALAAEDATVTFGVRDVVVATLGFGAMAFFAGAAPLVSCSVAAVLADLDARVFAVGLTALAAFVTGTSFSEELVAAVFVDAFLGFAAVELVAFGFFSTISLTASFVAFTCSLVAWAFFGRVVETCRTFWYKVFAFLRGATPVNHPLPHLDRSCLLGPSLSILSMLYAEP